MLRKLLSTSLFLGFFHVFLFAQQTKLMQRGFVLHSSTPTLELSAPNLSAIIAEDEVNDKNGMFYRIGVHTFTNITTQNEGNWTMDPEGNRTWQLHLKIADAEALSFLFEVFKIFDGTRVDIFDGKGKPLHKTVTSIDVQDHFQQNIALCFGDEMTIQIAEPYGSRPSEIKIDRIVYNYRSTGNPNAEKINESDECEVNVNCIPVGTNWQDEKKGVARIYIVDSQGAGWCTGSLVNNTQQNCKPYFLTSLHCGISTSASNSNLWRFYFKYESPDCTNPTSEGTLDDNYITGCVRIANSQDNGGASGSDFLLLQLGTLANEALIINTLKSPGFNAYWNGWDATNTVTTSGATIHHPMGDIKKISTYSTQTATSGWNQSGLSSHWRVLWSSNANGFGVTDGGSSGCALFNSSGRIIGTLTGGAASCDYQTAPDFYGKMSYHWTSNGTSADVRLKTYLDPLNTGATVLDGSYNPCVNSNLPPIADFVANPTTVSVGGTVQLTDLSENDPTSWAWSITPATGWSYIGGTTGTSQNPQVNFTTTGQYTVTLTATNGIGSDVEEKLNYITVTVVTTPCTASSTYCEEFLSRVVAGSIDNATQCLHYTVYPGTSFTKGQQYTLMFIPQVGSNVGYAYVDDEFAAWIDFNGDFDFNDSGEQVAYSIATTSGFINYFNIEIPLSAVTGNVYMRCRLHYSGADVGEGTVEPCGTDMYGEVEDYIINLTPPTSSEIVLTCGSEQTIYASSGQTTVPDVTSDASAVTTCSSGGVVLSQVPTVGTALAQGQNTITVTAADNCGNSQTCTTIINYENDLSISDTDFDNLSVYPIPVSDFVSVDLSKWDLEGLRISIMDNSGKLIYELTDGIIEKTLIDINQLACGTYQLKVQNATSSKVVRIIKL